MRRIRCFAMLSMTILLASCSVKEDRSDCPCWLTVDLSQTSASYLKLSAWCPVPVFSESIPLGERDDLHEYRVPRGQVRLSAYRETPGLFLEGDVLSITEGSQMDSLFASTVLADTDAEFAHESIRLQKNFTTVSVIFKDEADGRPEGHWMEVLGTVAGIDVQTLAPVPGRFSCSAEEAPEGGFSFRVPRQMDAELSATLYNESGVMMDSYPLGTLIQKAGFDWNKPDLGDITIFADIPTLSFTVSIAEWDGTTMQVTI